MYLFICFIVLKCFNSFSNIFFFIFDSFVSIFLSLCLCLFILLLNEEDIQEFQTLTRKTEIMEESDYSTTKSFSTNMAIFLKLQQLKLSEDKWFWHDTYVAFFFVFDSLSNRVAHITRKSEHIMNILIWKRERLSGTFYIYHVYML